MEEDSYELLLEKDNPFANEGETSQAAAGRICVRKHSELNKKENLSEYEKALLHFIQGVMFTRGFASLPGKLEDRDSVIDNAEYRVSLNAATAQLITHIEELQKDPTKDINEVRQAIENFQNTLPPSTTATGEIIVISGSVLIGAAVGMVIGFLLGQVIGAAIQAGGSPEAVLDLMSKFWDTVQESGFGQALGTQGLGMFIGSGIGTAAGAGFGGIISGVLSNSCLAHSTFFKDRKEQVQFYGNAVKEEAEKLLSSSEAKVVA